MTFDRLLLSRVERRRAYVMQQRQQNDIYTYSIDVYTRSPLALACMIDPVSCPHGSCMASTECDRRHVEL